MDLVQFWTICSMNNIIIDKEKLPNFERFHNELQYWNEKVNLISRKDLDNIYERHIIHSLTILKYCDLKKKANCLDIGTGGGFPGIPLSIARPDLKFLLMDSIAKKIKITSIMAQHTGSRDIAAKCSRVEELHNDTTKHQSFDYIFARAVTRTVSLLDWASPLLKCTGEVILLKGGDLKEEIEEARRKHPAFKFKEINIDIIGSKWFAEEEKKLIICSK